VKWEMHNIKSDILRIFQTHKDTILVSLGYNIIKYLP
jgi:hypothetical protein